MTHASVSDAAPLATVCIMNHNYAAFVGEAIDSALAQDYPHVEVIVVDDASTDGSQAVIEGYGTRIRPLLLPTNTGQNGAASEAVAIARGELVFLLDADDVFRPQKVRRMVEFYLRHPDGAVYTHRLPNGNANVSRAGVGKPVASLGDIRAQLMATNGFWPFQPTSGMVYPKWVLDRLMPIPAVESGGDLDLILAMLAPLLGPAYALDEPLAIRRLHDNNMYAHAERLAHREWTLRDNIARTAGGLVAANKVLERIGETFRYEPQQHLWVIDMRYQLGEASTLEMVRSRLRLTPWLGMIGMCRDMYFTMQRSRRVRRRLQRRRRRGKST